MNKPLFFLFAATLFLSSFLLFGVQSSLTDESLSLLLAELQISPAISPALFTIGRAALVPMLGFALAVAIKRLCPWRIQHFVYLFLWVQCFLAFLLLIPNKPGPGLAPGLTWMVVGLVSVLGCTNLALLPSWFLAVQRADDPDMSGNAAFWLSCWGLVGLIARSRPLAAFIPEFLICIVFGILVGTIVSSWLAPIIFPGPVLEYPLFLILACILRFLPAPLSVNRSQMRICA